MAYITVIEELAAAGLPERIWGRLQPEAQDNPALRGPCLMWTGALKGPRKYPQAWFEGTSWLLHILTWELVIGPRDLNLTLDHLCKKRLCVNPYHMEQITFRENLVRGGKTIGRKKGTHCQRGHLLRQGAKRQWCPTCQPPLSPTWQERTGMEPEPVVPGTLGYARPGFA